MYKALNRHFIVDMSLDIVIIVNLKITLSLTSIQAHKSYATL